MPHVASPNRLVELGWGLGSGRSLGGFLRLRSYIHRLFACIPWLIIAVVAGRRVGTDEDADA